VGRRRCAMLVYLLQQLLGLKWRGALVHSTSRCVTGALSEPQFLLGRSSFFLFYRPGGIASLVVAPSSRRTSRAPALSFTHTKGLIVRELDTELRSVSAPHDAVRRWSMTLEGKSALVTGSTSGIGLALPALSPVAVPRHAQWLR